MTGRHFAAPRLGDALDGVGQLQSPSAPAPLPLSLAGAGALAINLSCAFMLARHRAHAGSLTRAAFLSSRNDVLANIAIIARRYGDRLRLAVEHGLI